MYLQGHIYRPSDITTIDDFTVKEIVIELGYWRKHPDLHGAIVQTFADGVDDCNCIELSEDDLHTIISMIKSDSLPETSGFFFGRSYKLSEKGYNEQKEQDIEVFQKALKWIQESKKRKDASLYWITYRGSW